MNKTTKTLIIYLMTFALLYTNTKDNPLVFRHFRVAGHHTFLNLDGALRCVDHRRELKQQPITHRLNDTAAMLVDVWIDQFGPVST